MGIGDIANSGMQAAMSNMEVISNNIANANTLGFKKSYINFADIYPSMNGSSASNAVGMGVGVSSVFQDFSNGDPSYSGNPFDMSINNNGFFILRDQNSGQISYTRAGRFLPVGGYLTYGNQRLQGFPASNNTIPPGSTVSDIQISNASLPATATTTANIAVNLSSNDATPVNPVFSPTDNTSYNYTSNVSIFDSLGNAHNVTSYYVKQPTENTWEVYVCVDNTQITGTPGTLTFSPNGVLTGSSGLTNLQFSPTTGANSPQTFTINTANTTQVSTQDSIISVSANGNAPATFDTVQIDPNGMVWMVYSGNMKLLAGQVGLADFQSPQSLTDIGNMQWIANSESGNAVVNQSNSLSNISTGYVELSNVDLTTEMVNLIGAQHTFQANAQVEQAYNEVMNTVIKL